MARIHAVNSAIQRKTMKSMHLKKIYRICIYILFFIPEICFAQQPTETSVPVSNPPNTTSTVTPANPTTQPNPQRRRRRRTIQNREFDDREKIILLLSAHCEFPTKEDLLSTSEDVEKHLQTIIDDKDLLLTVRMRAVEALSYFATPMNRETLEAILAHPEKAEHQLMVIQAIRAYAKIAPEQAPEVLKPFLSDKTDFYRFVAITSLRDCPGEAALRVLKERYEQENNRYFQTRLKQAIDSHCDKDVYCQQ